MGLIGKDKRETITEEVLEINKMDADVCKHLEGEYTDDGRCIVRLERDPDHPMEAHLRAINFKSAGRRRFAEE